jgi:hypothetical protein
VKRHDRALRGAKSYDGHHFESPPLHQEFRASEVGAVFLGPLKF